jgi:O-antigen ligase
MFVDNPVTGVGINNFGRAFAAYRPPGYVGAIAPHSIFIQVLSELGIVGLGVLLALLFLILKRNADTRRIIAQAGGRHRWITESAHGLDLALIAYVVGGIFLTALYFPHLFILSGFTLSLNAIAKDIAVKEENAVGEVQAPAEAGVR